MLRVTDAPGYYAAFPWGVTLRKRGRPRAATPLAHALYIPLSLPRIFLHLAVYSGTVAISTEKYTEGLHLGGVFPGQRSIKPRVCDKLSQK